MKKWYLLGFILVLAVVGAIIYPYRPTQSNPAATNETPSSSGLTNVAKSPKGAPSAALPPTTSNVLVRGRTVIRPQILPETNAVRPPQPAVATKSNSTGNAASIPARRGGTNAAAKNLASRAVASAKPTAVQAPTWIQRLRQNLTSPVRWYFLGAILALLCGLYGLFHVFQSKRTQADKTKPGRIAANTRSSPSGGGGLPSSGSEAGQKATAGMTGAGSGLPAADAEPAAVLRTPKPRHAPAKLRFNSCNVLQYSAAAHQLWQFNVAGQEVSFNFEKAATNAESLPKKQVAKGPQALWRPRLNVAWLPPEQVFLRVIQLPACEADELPAMVEMQLEKLSPMPVAQIVWTYEVLGAVTEAQQQQTVIVLLVSRGIVEEFLGRLEGQGYLADRLELPQLHQLLTTPIDGDGIWLFPDAQGLPPTCLVAWWYGKSLRWVSGLRIPPGQDWAESFTKQLTQIAWAGQLEGWLSGALRCRLVADARLAETWAPMLESWSQHPVEVLPHKASRDLATLQVQRLARHQSQSNLLPEEYATRYRQQFIDSLWMGGLGALLVIYLAVLGLVFAGVQLMLFQCGRLDREVAALKPSYVEAQQAKAKLQVLQDQLNLRYAGLECWKAAAEFLPQGLTLTGLTLQQGKTLTLHGFAPTNDVNAILEYNRNLSQYRGEGTNALLLFSSVRAPNSTLAPNNSGELSYRWDFSCELRQEY